ncbi:hypothetical protein [Gloeobacter kilaueensis]|uniref:Uncharacterized protein n=1 Tax=Gloeobacter kilaueensis (strain ATCC BAA-2537 / CCAP 1431/1 / ULC 316 / JS1) TaxID=1183438 RepID=U5QM59_GLOK1|nr:hypothetical protein [Gloeobacter kilaueensis]AGY60072.1 hypothetical protein GKIL_3826 [Gloeobacter kilaueensis JS1]
MPQPCKIAIVALTLALGMAWASPLLAASPLTQGPGVDWQGKPISLDRLKDRVTVVIASSNDTKDVGAVVDQALLSAFGDNPRFQLIRVVNLVGVPSFAEDIVIDTIKERDAAEMDRIKAEYTAAGRTYQPPVADTFFVLDWEGRLRQALLAASPRPEYALFKEPPRRTTSRYKSPEQKERESLDNHLHVFLLDTNGEVKAHYLDAVAVEQALNDVRSQLTPPAPPPVPSTSSTPGG